MILLFTSFMAGVITVLSPCVLPMLPVILGKGVKNIAPLIRITFSIMITVIVATLILKGAIGLIITDTTFLQYIAGIILILLSLTYIFPLLWAKIEVKFHLSGFGNKILSNKEKGSFISDILIGFALALVFNSCSPTYAIIVSTILPSSFLEGLLYVTIYSIGLGISLFIVGIFGKSIIDVFKFSINPEGKFRKMLGYILLIIGILILTGIFKSIEAYLLKLNIIDIVGIEALLPEFEKK